MGPSEELKPGDILWDGRDGTMCAVVDEVDEKGRWTATTKWTDSLMMLTGQPVKFDRIYPSLWYCESGSHAKPN